MKHRLVAFLIIAAILSVFVTGCGQEDTNVTEPVEFTQPVFSFSSLTTQVPVNPGMLHNAILAQMGAASIEPGSIESIVEFATLFRTAVNNALAPYGPSRLVTKDECLLGLSLGRLIDPLYDLSFTDETRLDPSDVIDFWRGSELFTTAELDQVEAMLAAPSGSEALAMASTIELDPESDAVAAAASVFNASMFYWSTSGPSTTGCADDYENCVHTLRRTIGDSLGGMLGALMGGPIAAGIVGCSLSVIFTINEGSYPPSGDHTGLPPAPCGGYHGVGPCP